MQVRVSTDPSTFEHMQFDVYGQSPLVKHFLDQRTLSRENETKVLTGRTELLDEPVMEFVSYQDIVADAIENELSNHKEFEK